MSEATTGRKILRVTGKVLLWIPVVLSGLLPIFFLILQIPAVQTRIRVAAVSWLEEKLDTTVKLDDIDINIFRHVVLDGLYIQDLEGDTLLYAEHAAIRIRSVNPLSKDIRLRTLELKGCYAHVYRHPEDSSFNFQFIADAFASDKEKDTTSAPSALDLGIKEIDFKQVHFQFDDSLSYQAYDTYLHSFRATFNKFSLQEEVLAVNQLEADGCTFQLSRLLDLRPEEEDTIPSAYAYVHIRPGNWILEASHLQLKNCFFGYQNENHLLREDLMDFNHLALRDINIDMEEIVYAGDTVRGYMNQVACTDRSGFRLQTLQSAFFFSGTKTILNGLLLETANSRITDNLQFSYASLLDFNRIFDAVEIRANLRNTVVSTDDLAYFSASLGSYHSLITANMPVSGTLSNLKASGAQLAVDQTLSFQGDLRIRGLPVIDETWFDVDLRPLQANMPGLNEQLGGVLPSQITELGQVEFKGKYTGFIYDFVVYGQMESTIGSLNTDIRMQYDPDAGNTHYSGSIATEELNAGLLAGLDDMLGTVSLVATVEGNSSPGKNDLVLSSQVSDIWFNGYRYRDLQISGQLSNDGFDGRLNMNDPNARLSFLGSVHIADSTPVMNFESTIEHADLQLLKIYPTPLTISAHTQVDITGSDINSFLGSAVLDEVHLSTGKYNWDQDRISLTSRQENGVRNTRLESDLLNISVIGSYQVDQLPRQFTGMVNYYLHGTPFMTDSMVPQQFEYNISGHDLHQATAIFYPDIEQLGILQLSGLFDSGQRHLTARWLLKNTQYKGIYTENVAGEISDREGHLSYFLRAAPIQVSEQLQLPVSSLEGALFQDSVDVNLKMGKDVDPERLNLYAGIKVSEENLSLHVLPSEIFVSNERWDIQPNNSLIYDYENFYADQFTLTNLDKKVSITSSNKEGMGAAFRVLIENFRLEDIAKIAQYDDYALAGRIDANVTISDPFDSLTVLGFINIKEFILDAQPIGNINLTATRIFPNPHLNFNMNLQGANSMRAYGYYSIGETDSLHMVAEIAKIPFKVAEPFTVGLMSDLRGDAYGTVRVEGPVNDLQTSGYVEMKNGGFYFDYLGIDMDFQFQKVELFPDRIYLTPNKVFDESGNEGWVKGNIYHTAYDHFVFDSLVFNSGNFVLMNATVKENPDFYGYTSGQVNAVIDGPLEDLQVTIDATPVKTPGKANVVYIPAYGSGNVSRHNFIQFVDRSDSTGQAENNNKSLSVVSVSTFVQVTPDVEVQILLSSEGSDVIKGAGSGNLFIDVNTLGKVEISGLLKITQGSYDFSFEGLATKKFIVKEGGTILFDQDPYQAKLGLTAVYRLDKVQKLGLISDLPLSDPEIQEARKAIPVDVYINIGGTLEAPEISFDIILPDERSSGGLSEFDQRLSEVKSDQNELNKQVFGLLMINNFLPKELNAGAALGAGVNSSISDFITSQLSGYFSDWISEIIPNAEIDIGYQKIGSGDLGLSESDQTQFEAGLTQKLFGDALTVKIGGTYNYEASSSNPNANLAGDFEVEYRITPDGRIRVKAFRESDFDAVASKNDVRTGLGLFYTKDFDSFSELFESRRRQQTP